MFILEKASAADCVAKKLQLVNEQHNACQIEKLLAKDMEWKLAPKNSPYHFASEFEEVYLHNTILGEGHEVLFDEDLIDTLFEEVGPGKEQSFVFGVRDGNTINFFAVDADELSYWMIENGQAIDPRTAGIWITDINLKKDMKKPVKTPKIKKQKMKKLKGRFPAVTDSQMKKDYKDFVGSLPNDLKKSLRTYTGNAYSDMNSLLRTGKTTEWGPLSVVETKKHIKNIDQVMEASSAPRNFKVYRGAGRRGINDQYIGKNFSDKAFMSTSIDFDVTRGFGSADKFIEINVPKGAKGVYLETITQQKVEYEFLLPKNAKLFCKERVFDESLAAHIYKCDYIPD